MLYVYLKNLSVEAIIGIHEWERNNRQTIRISLKLYPKQEITEDSDEIDDALDYQTVAELVTEFVQNSEFLLVEKLANSICELLTGRFELSKIVVKVGKPQAISNADEAGVTVERTF